MNKQVKQYLTGVGALGKNKGKGGSRVLGVQSGRLVKKVLFQQKPEGGK